MFLLVWSDRFLIAGVTLAVTLVAVIISLVLPPYFRATALLLPNIDNRQAASLSGLSGLTSLIGGRLGQVSVEQLFPTIAQSQTILYDAIQTRYATATSKDSVTLLQFWGVHEESPTRDMEVAFQELNKRLDVNIDLRTGVVTLSILMEEPQLAADVLNRVVNLLDDFIRTKRKTTASEERKWVENRLTEVKVSLDSSEKRLRDFMEQNRQTESPRLTMEQGRLTREVQINSSIYVELKNRLEIAQIDEINNVPVITVLDYGRAAARKEKPKRRMITLAAFLLSLAGSVGYVLTKAQYGGAAREAFQDLRMALGKKARPSA